MRIRRSIPAAAVLVVLLAAAASAQAAPTLYSGIDLSTGGSVPAGGNARAAYAAFVAATRSLTSEDFESFGIGLTTSPLSILGGSGTLTPDASAGVDITNATPASGPGRFNTTPFDCAPGACRWVETYTSFSVTLDDAVSAFGFFNTDLGDRGALLTLDFFNGAAAVLSDLIVPASGERGVGFFGLVDNTDKFDRVVFNISQPVTDPDFADFVGFDGFVRASLPDVPPPVVPEPGSLALVAAGLGLLGAVRRRAR